MIRQLLSLFIISISFISIVSVQAAGGVIVTRGQAQNINWSVNGASGCNAGYQGTSYPGPADTTDTVANDWEQGGAAGVYSNTGNATLTFHGRTGTAFPQTYVFKCIAVGSPAFFDTATVTINDCPNGTTWNGTTCLAEAVPPNPTGLTLTSNISGTSMTASWTIPAGYTAFKTRGENLTTGVANIGAPAWDENFIGSSITFSTTPGQTYHFWLHTISPSGTQISSGTGANETARNPVASFTATPACTIATDTRGCWPYNIGWTSSDTNGGVTLTDCGAGFYSAHPGGAQSGQVFVPYNSGCYRIYNGQYATDAALAAAIAAGQTQILAETNPYVSSSCTDSNTTVDGGGYCRVTMRTITASAGVNGTISPSGSVQVVNGTNQTFTITPNSQYSIASVLIDGVAQGGLTADPYTITLSNVTAAHTLTATFGTPTGTLSSGVACKISTGNSTCNQLFNVSVTDPYGFSQIIANGGAGPNSLHDIPAGITTRTLALTYGSKIYQLYNNSRSLYTVGPIAISCVNNNGWDATGAGKCVVDPYVSSAVITGDYYQPTGTYTISCSDSNNYQIVRVSDNVVISSGPYTGQPIVYNNLTITGDYKAVCLMGTYQTPTPMVRTYNSPPPNPEIVSLTATPRTINKDENTTIAWEVKFPANTCSLTAKVACAGGVCSTAQTVFEQGLGNKLTSESTDSNDPHTSRNILSAVKTLAPGEQNTTWRGFGKKTFKISYTTDFTLACGGKSETKRIQISKSTEQ